MKWKVEKKKKREDGDNGYTCVVEKNQEKRKRKKKKETYGWLKERNEKYNLEMLPQYFHNIFTINFK